MPATGYFDVTLVPDEWFDETVVATSWYDDTIDALVALAPSAQASATATAFVTAPAALTATAAGTNAATSALNAPTGLAPVASGVSAAVGSLRATAQLSAATTATTAATATVRVPTPYDLLIDADSPVSHWKLGDPNTAFDRKQTLDLPATVGPISTASGLIANNGSDLANVFPGTSATRFDATGGPGRGVPYDTDTWSIEVWANCSSVANTPTVIYRQSTAAQELWVDPSQGWVIQSRDAAATIHQVWRDSAAITLGQTYHVVGTYDGTNMILYVNGAEIARAAMPSQSHDSQAAPNISSRRSGATGLTGTIDEVAWYATALSPARVLAHYQTGAGITSQPLAPAAQAVAQATVAIGPPVTPTAQASAAATATVFIPTNTAYPDLILGETGLVSYWRLDESSGNALDSKDSNPGTTFGANVTRNVSGLITNSTNAATAGDGSTADWITVPSSSNMDVGTRLTVEFWCRPAALPAVPAYLVDRGTDGPFWIRHYATGDGRWEFNVKDSSLVRISFTGGAGTAAQAGVLQHIVMTYDAVAGAMKGYVNGVAVGTGAPAPTLPVNSGGILCLLNRTSGFAGGFNGTLDEVALYNVALTPVQILTHYLTGIGTPALIPKATATAAATAAIIAPGPATVTPVAQASAAAAARITTAAYPNRILGETGLVSYWRLGEASGNALDAKDSNPAVQQGTAMVRNVPGLLTTNIDAAAQNDGSAGSYFEAAYAANMNVGNAITVECWVKLSAYVNGRIIVARESANVCWMLKEATSTGYQWVVRDANGVDTLVAVVPNSLVVGAVQHLVGVYDGAGGRCELWVNGVSVGTPGRTPNANVRDSTSQPLHIGGDSFFGDMAGVIDEVALYNVALTPAQITNHYLAGSDTPALAPTAVATSVAATALSAAAVLAAAASAVGTGTVVLSAPALLAPSAAAVTQASAAATAAAVLTAAATALAQATATTTAPSQLTAAAMTIATATATLTATGAAFLTPTATATGVASLAATAPTLLTAATAAVTLATGATTASAQLAATATGIGTASASLSAPVQLAATATGMGAASTSLSAPAKLVAAATGSGAAIALLSAPASLTATATTLASATETLTAPSVVTPAAQAIAAATAISTAPARVTAAATAVAQATLALTAGGIALSAAATALAGASTTVTTTAPLVASGQAIGLAAATLTTTPALTPVATAVTQAAAALTARAMLTAAAVAPAGASALVSSGAIAIAGTAQAVAASTAALTAPSSLAANATGLATAVSFVTASPMITPQATTTASATTALRVTMGVSGAAQALSAAQLASLRVGQSLQANATGVARATLTIGLAGSLYPVARAVSAASTTVTAPPYGKVHLLIGTSVALTLVLGDTTAYDLKTVTTTTPELALRESSAYDLQIKATTARDETVSTH